MTQPPFSPNRDRVERDPNGDSNGSFPTFTPPSSRQLAAPPQKASRAQVLRRLGRSIKAKTIVWALAISVLPVVVLGTVVNLGSQSIREQITQARLGRDPNLEATELALEQQLFLLSLGTGILALLSGGTAAWGVSRLVRPVREAALASNKIVHRLRQAPPAHLQTHQQDELHSLSTNIELIDEQLPVLLSQQDSETERSQALMQLTRQIWESPSEEEVLGTTVAEVRKLLKADRVTILRFDDRETGTFIAEAVLPSWSKTQSISVRTPYSKEELKQYWHGCVIAIDSIYEANLSDSHRSLLELLKVKASLEAPIVKDKQLFGLLIVHQCSHSRFWQQLELDLVAQVTTQAGLALDYARLLKQVDSEASQAQQYIEVTRRIRGSLYEEEILKTTVAEVRKALGADRVIVYGFDADWYGTVIAESVLPGWPKALHARIKDPCFAEGYVDKYREGRVHALNNIYEAGLSECYLGQLEPFAVKANLVAPIIKDEKLFGLLIAHQCSWTRQWQQSEIDFFAQLAIQVGFALDHARLLARVDDEGRRAQLFSEITRQIRESINEEEILKTTVAEVRKALGADRVIVYGFDADWYGTVIAESVLPGWPKALHAEIKDPCFAEGYVDKYREGRVHALNNIYEAGLSECYLGQLEPFAVKANLVAPIIKDEKLFGLLIAHQCSGSRQWQQSEIDFFAQLAIQVGFALDHARLLIQVERAYQSAEAVSHNQRQQKEVLQHQVANLRNDSEAIVDALSIGALNQMEFVTTTYNQIQATRESVGQAIATLADVEALNGQTIQAVQMGQEAIEQARAIGELQETFNQASERIEQLDRSFYKLAKIVNLFSNFVSQVKFQATKASLEAARLANSEEFAAIAQKLLELTRQVDVDLAEVKPLIANIQTHNQEITAIIHAEAEQVSKTQWIQQACSSLDRIVSTCNQVHLQLTKIAQTINATEQNALLADRSILAVADMAKQLSSQSVVLVESFTRLEAFTQE